MKFEPARIKEVYEELRRELTTLEPWNQLNEAFAAAMIRAYEAGARDAREAKQLPVAQGHKVQQGGALDFSHGRSPQREALFRRMYNAVICELVPEEGVEDDVFKGMHQHMVRMAIADLAASLLPFAVDDADELDNSVWAALVDEIRDEMRLTILDDGGDMPLPVRQ
jgi:hypothetical protein